ncbi:hypothetical protein [Actinacidiphila acididurans]|uniref:Uncharacterized protein n=1 Tax=Actinacidiphila acididurans TaxID=2784346 RepID=A0ABS2TVJ4_9ACTN|nr:hypothetical protein [Actinacidiphila acididurans]MBM9506531.1 hypothetical protein [Actinacidiphila acididurans]
MRRSTVTPETAPIKVHACPCPHPVARTATVAVNATAPAADPSLMPL